MRPANTSILVVEELMIRTERGGSNKGSVIKGGSIGWGEPVRISRKTNDKTSLILFDIHRGMYLVTYL
jgi:hypothetical protein